MTKIKLILVVLLVVGLAACKPTAGDKRAKALMGEGNGLLTQSNKLTEQWSNEYQRAFNPENQAKFPANRDTLRVHADKIIVILDEESTLQRRMAEKYEEASTLLSNDKDRKGVDLIAGALRRNMEVNELLKSQMRLVSDEEIKDGKTLKEKILQSWQVIQQKQRESENELKEGKRLLGI